MISLELGVFWLGNNTLDYPIQDWKQTKQQTLIQMILSQKKSIISVNSTHYTVLFCFLKSIKFEKYSYNTVRLTLDSLNHICMYVKTWRLHYSQCNLTANSLFRESAVLLVAANVALSL